MSFSFSKICANHIKYQDRLNEFYELNRQPTAPSFRITLRKCPLIEENQAHIKPSLLRTAKVLQVKCDEFGGQTETDIQFEELTKSGEVGEIIEEGEQIMHLENNFFGRSGRLGMSNRMKDHEKKGCVGVDLGIRELRELTTEIYRKIIRRGDCLEDEGRLRKLDIGSEMAVSKGVCRTRGRSPIPESSVTATTHFNSNPRTPTPLVEHPDILPQEYLPPPPRSRIFSNRFTAKYTTNTHKHTNFDHKSTNISLPTSKERDKYLNPSTDDLHIINNTHTHNILNIQKPLNTLQIKNINPTYKMDKTQYTTIISPKMINSNEAPVFGQKSHPHTLKLKPISQIQECFKRNNNKFRESNRSVPRMEGNEIDLLLERSGVSIETRTPKSKLTKYLGETPKLNKYSLIMHSAHSSPKTTPRRKLYFGNSGDLGTLNPNFQKIIFSRGHRRMTSANLSQDILLPRRIGYGILNQ